MEKCREKILDKPNEEIPGRIYWRVLGKFHDRFHQIMPEGFFRANAESNRRWILKIILMKITGINYCREVKRLFFQRFWNKPLWNNSCRLCGKSTRSSSWKTSEGNPGIIAGILSVSLWKLRGVVALQCWTKFLRNSKQFPLLWPKFPENSRVE